MMSLKDREAVESILNDGGVQRQILKELQKANKPAHWTEGFRMLTPVGLAVVGYFISVMNGNFTRLDTDVKDMRIEISHHLQNSELHVPRSTVVSKDEFVIYQAMRDKQMVDLSCGISRIEDKMDRKK
jgi:hypothetical protein